MIKAIGKNTLGQGEKMNVHLKGYDLSTHDLSEVRKTTMSPGTLNPVFTTIGLPGDVFDMELHGTIYTEPTVGPNYDSFKYQVDVFKADMRLYQSMLQNNELDAGMNMETITFPQLILSAQNTFPNDFIDSNQQVNPSSILSRLGIKGVGHSVEENPSIMEREFCANHWLAYWDIFKNFYANKQEKKAYVIHNEIPVNFAADIHAISQYQWGFGTWDTIPAVPTISTAQVLTKGDLLKIELPNGYNLAGTYPQYIMLTLQLSAGVTVVVPSTEVFAYKTEDLEGPYDSWVLEGVKKQWYGWTIQNYEVLNYRDIPTLPPTLQEFDLSLIDDMRREILSSATGVTLTKFSDAPFGYALGTYTDPLTSDSKTSIQGTQEGLAVKTYQSDIFNNWIRTEFVENTNTKTSINVAGGSLSMDSLALARRMWELENRISVSGGTIDDYIETVWASGRPNNVTIPEYMGGMSREVEFEAVLSTAGTADVPLGQLGGRGISKREKNGGKIRIVVGTSPCVILAIASLTPRIGYSQGNDWTTNLKNMSELHVPQLDGIGYENLITDRLDWRDTEINNVTSPQPPEFRSMGYQPAWINYTTGYNKIDGNFAILEKTGFMVNDRHYEWDGTGVVGTKDKTAYIDPTHYNYTFVNTQLDAMNFWVMQGIKCTVRRKMSARQIPNQ